MATPKRSSDTVADLKIDIDKLEKMLIGFMADYMEARRKTLQTAEEVAKKCFNNAERPTSPGPGPSTLCTRH